MKRRIAVVTGTRAEFGLLRPLLDELRRDPRCDLRLIATAMHLSPRFGATASAIRAARLPIAAEVPCLLDGGDDLAVAQSTALAMHGIAIELKRLRPDALVLLGDRFEVLAAASAATLLRIPIAHIHGGESTEGLVDEAIRHAVSKMASLHFPCAEPYAARLRAMGEEAARVHVVGALGLDAIRRRRRVPRARFLAAVGVSDRGPLALVTFHPVTLRPGGSLRQVRAMCDALARAQLGGVVLTYPNADAEGAALIAELERFAAAHGNAVVRASLGQELYLAALEHVDVMVGNSSSGIIEAPSFRLPVVNIGERQRGRLRHANVIDCAATAPAIAAALRRALRPAFRRGLAGLRNAFGDGRAAARIAAALLGRPLPDLAKRFADGDEFRRATRRLGLRR